MVPCRELLGSPRRAQVTEDEGGEHVRLSHLCDEAGGRDMVHSAEEREEVGRGAVRAGTVSYVHDLWYGGELWLQKIQLVGRLREK